MARFTTGTTGMCLKLCKVRRRAAKFLKTHWLLCNSRLRQRVYLCATISWMHSGIMRKVLTGSFARRIGFPNHNSSHMDWQLSAGQWLRLCRKTAWE